VSTTTKARIGALTALVAATTLTATAPALAASQASADGIASAVDRAAAATGSPAVTVDAQPRGTGFAGAGTTKVTIPPTADGAVKATSAGRTIGVSLGTADATKGTLAADGTVVYDDASTAVDQTVQPTDDGVRIHTVIQDATAASRYVHHLTLPAGARAELTPTATGNAVLIYQGAQLIGGFAPPWATDAAGTPIATHYELAGTDLIQTVDHQAADVRYPVVADPYLGFDLIKSSAWHLEAGFGWTLRVTPTGWARSLAGAYAAGVAGWNELYKKRKNSGLNTNLGGMRDQYICHQQVVAVRSPRKPTWNLDEWRRDVSYAATIAARCNPGGTHAFD
jgi:hypothetical protein